MKVVVAAVAVGLCARSAAAENDCRSVDVRFVPSDGLQIAAWIEDTDGNYIETVFITQSTGLHGLGNRTGIMGLHTGPRWPYGSREDVLPIWAHRHGLEFPQVVWQAEYPQQTCDILTTFAQSSSELFYCRPMQPIEPQWDAGTCASNTFTDKGKFSPTLTSHYPPRADLISRAMTDSADAAHYAELNVFDAVSRATPPGDQPYDAIWALPPSLADGDYVLHVEASKERDFNATYTEATYPTTQCTWHEYGVPYRGQPSVVYDVPFTIGATDSTASTATYAGYSDLDGVVHAPDSTITSDTPGSGSSRLRIVADGNDLYRVRVTTHVTGDTTPPASPSNAVVAGITPSSATLTFVAPGDDALSGTISSYDIRIRAGYSLDDATFRAATPIDQVVPPIAAGGLQTVALDHLAPNTPYVIGIRAYDDCNYNSPLLIVRFETPTAEVSACGCTSSDPRGFGVIVIGFAFALRRRRRR